MLFATASRSGLVPRSEVARQHQFERQFVSPGGQTKADASLDIQELAIAIHNSPDLVKLLVQGKELPQRAEIGILLSGNGPLIIHVVCNSTCGNEFQVA